MPFNRQPALDGPLVHLRPLQSDDFDALFAAANDPLLWEQHPVNDRYTEAGFKRFFDDAIASGGALIASDAATDQVIGSSRYHGYNEAEREIEIGWSFLARSHWGGQYNGDMKRLMLEHAFQYVDRVVLLIGPTNLRSQKAAEKIGAVREGERIDGNGMQSVAYVIHRDR